MKKYYKIEWTHNFGEEYPYQYFIETGADCFEVRRIEKYSDGRILFASKDIEHGTYLSPEPIKSISIFNSSDEDEIIKGFEIDKADFFHEWNKLAFE